MPKMNRTRNDILVLADFVKKLIQDMPGLNVAQIGEHCEIEMQKRHIPCNHRYVRNAVSGLVRYDYVIRTGPHHDSTYTWNYDRMEDGDMSDPLPVRRKFVSQSEWYQPEPRA